MTAIVNSVGRSVKSRFEPAPSTSLAVGQDVGVFNVFIAEYRHYITTTTIMFTIDKAYRVEPKLGDGGRGIEKRIINKYTYNCSRYVTAYCVAYYERYYE